MTSADFSESVDVEDRAILEKLAKLQNMSSQIGGLRSLLPEKLINPARFALDNPGNFEPEKLATFLQTAAKTGSKDVEKFKKDWHSDDVRELWQTVNTNDLPQGVDAWPLDYGVLVQDTATSERTSIHMKNASAEFQPRTSAETITAVNDFRARHPDLKMHVSDGPDPLPIDIQVAQLLIRIEQTPSTGGVEYNVTSTPGTPVSNLLRLILQTISESQKTAPLGTILDMIASYKDLKQRPCQKCQKIYHAKTLELPLVRQAAAVSDDKGPTLFLALHRTCT